MEPGVLAGPCRECRIGRYNLCKDIRFWATPPHDGVLAEHVLHPAAMTFRLPAHMTTEEGALMEPLAVGVHAANAAVCARQRGGYKWRRDHRMCNAPGSSGLRGFAGDCG